jgi:predicted ATP-dependent endonuclease of OLD family
MQMVDLHLSGIGGIDALDLQFGRGVNILCGPNGIGKTTIIEAIAHCFVANGTTTLKRNALAEIGSVTASVMMGEEKRDVTFNIEKFSPRDNSNLHTFHEYSISILYLSINRNITYSPLDAVGRDPPRDSNTVWQETKMGVHFSDAKNWFVNRYLYSAHGEALNETQHLNLKLAKDSFSILNSEFAFDFVDASTNEIMISTPNGKIYYEYLSSGFKSIISIIFSIIKEVEFRFKENRVLAASFDGIILIDEIELHLHPVWQSQIIESLAKIFPYAQFIVTTHSPHVVQAAEPNQILVLERVNGRVQRRAVGTSKYGFKNWTLDEVLTDVMGMESTETNTFTKLMRQFDDAIDHSDSSAAENIFLELDISLHPNNHLRKLLRLQLASVRDAI